MAQQPSDAVVYTFSARTLIRPDVVTVLPYFATSSPDVVHSAKLTITRRFYDHGATNSSHEDGGETAPSNSGPPSTVFPPRSALKSSSRTPNVTSRAARSPSPTATAQALTSRETTPASSDHSSSRATSRQPSVGPDSRYTRTYTPPPSTVTATPSSRATSRQSSVVPDSILDTPSSPRRTPLREPLPHLDEFVAKRGPITRSVSRGSLRVETIPSESIVRKGRTRRSSALDQNDDYLQYKRETWKIPQTDEEKARGERFVTTWFYSSASYSVDAPPPCMAVHPDLKLGDLFFHCTAQSTEPQVWWWIEGNDGQSFWKRVFRGHTRPDDKRRLSMATSKDGTARPSWVSDTWFQKQEKEIKSRKKGKAADSGS